MASALAEKFSGGGKKKQKRAIAHQKSLPLIVWWIIGDALDNCPGSNLKDILHHDPRIKVKTFSREKPISEKNVKKLSGHSRAKKLFA